MPGRFNLFLSLLIFISSSISHSSAAATEDTLNFTPEEKEWLRNAPVIRVALDAGFPPYSFLDDKGQYQGVSADYIDLISRRLGLKVKLVPFEKWSDLMDAAKKREVDLVTTMSKRPEREKFMAFTRIYIHAPLVIMTRNDNDEIRKRDDLAGRRIALVQGYNVQKSVCADYPDLTMVPADSNLDSLKSVSAGDAEATVGNIGVLTYECLKNGISNLKIGAFYTEGLRGESIGVRKDWAVLASILDKTINAIPEAEKLRIINKWVPTLGPGTETDQSKVVLTAEELEWIDKHPVITIGVDPEFLPFEYISEDGTYSGMASEYIKLLNDRLGINMQVVPKLKWKEVVVAAEKREIDVLPCVGLTADRQKYLLYSEPYLSFYRVMITRIRPKGRFISSIDDIVGMNVAVQANTSHHAYIKDNTDIVPIAYDTLQEALLAVSDGEAEVLVGNVAASSYWIQKLALTNLKIAAPVSSEIKHLHFAIRNDWPELQSIINKGLNSISLTESAQIRDKWINVEYEPGIDIAKVRETAIKIGITTGILLLAFVVRNFGMKKEIDHRKILERDLFEAKIHADVANKAKSEFLANMSHEIRTPMNAVLGFTEIMREKEKDPAKLHYLDCIHSSGKSLLGLINDILDFSKIEAGKLTLEYSAVSVRELCNDVKVIFEQKAASKGLALLIDVDPEVPSSLILDELRLRQILINLTGNAIKFTEKGFIKISAAPAFGYQPDDPVINLNISVKDTGIGIPEESQQKIFEAFEQSQGQKTSKYGGTGLGLAISHRLTQLMNGELLISSEPGQGATFTAALRDVEKGAEPGLTTEESRLADFSSIIFEPADIIIADDIDYVREVLTGYISDWPFKIEQAVNGADLIRKATDNPPDLIILDVKMPVMDGIEAAKAIKKDRLLKHIPLIAVSASAVQQEETLMRSLCAEYIHKPVGKEALLSALLNVLPHKLKTEKNESIEKQADGFPELNYDSLISMTERLKSLKENELRSVLHKMTVNDIKKFITDVSSIATEYNYAALLTWVSKLQSLTLAFNPTAIRDELHNFETFITDTELHLNQINKEQSQRG